MFCRSCKPSGGAGARGRQELVDLPSRRGPLALPPHGAYNPVESQNGVLNYMIRDKELRQREREHRGW